jgi:hypothetical protein
MGYAKKEREKRKRKRKISMLKGMREKYMPKSMKKRKERNKDSPYFQIKYIHPKRERFMIQRSTKNI